MVGWRNRVVGVAAAFAFLALAGESSAQGRGTARGVVLAPTGEAQPNITLIMTNAQGVERRAVSDSSGAFVFGGLQPGPYRLRTDDDTFAPYSDDQVVVASGQTLSLEVRLRARVSLTASPTQRAAVQGTVIGPEGRPSPNVVIIITNTEGIDRRAVSDGNGAFVFGGLPPGPYRLRVEDAGPASLPFPSVEIVFAPGERRQFDIRLQPIPPAPVAPRLPDPVVRETPDVITRDKESRREKDDDKEAPEVTAPGGEFEAMPNRWKFKYPAFKRYSDESRMPWIVGGGPFDSYNQNKAKGDFPVIGETIFANLNIQLNSTANPRVVSAGDAEPTSQVFTNHNLVAGLELFRGNTVFEPKRWAIRATVVGNLNDLSTGQRNNKIGLEEAFIEKRLAILSPSFDFVSIRVGMQNFNSDFRGYVFADNQLGARLFGNAKANQHQYNVAYFKMRERDPASQLHLFSSRDQDVFIANYYIQDFGTKGYTAMFNLHVNRDTGTAAGPGASLEGALNVTYLGFHGDGKWGTWAVSHAFYQAFGKDDDSLIARRLRRTNAASPADINARMAAFELSKDADWRRYRLTGYFASGDDGSDPTKAKGFDTITDNPNLAGGQFMFWAQQNTQVPGGGGKFLVSEKFSLLPNLRSKFRDRANFVNPGLMLLGGGIDLRMSPSLKVTTNVSYLRFADAAVLRALAGPGRGFEDGTIGIDASIGAKFRPFVSENVFVVAGFATLIPRGGFATAIGSNKRLHSVVGAIQLAY
ncbi:MAG: carboxypeptidase regulatory-like domain-containing protein [Vicinamibacteria bacterium]|nr:carboxypeptidase regulatory-like domain-containing protein [Vicinamibacteria bacterium]